MWKLKNIKKDHWEHCIFVGDNCIVGRKDAALLISNDPSISRKHAALFIRHPVENIGNTSKKSSLFIRDEGSKYGTFKNGEKVTSEVELMNGDVVKFGQFESEFSVQYVPLVITTSCLDAESKDKLTNCIHLLGGHVVPQWQPSCTHLVMSEVKVTVKALCCLVSLKPIVKSDYFEELLTSLKSSSTVLCPKKYLPPIGESLIDKDKVSFDVNPQRKNMFKSKTFLFLDEKQYKKLHLGIITGGGKASIINEKNRNLDSLLNENTCIIEPIRSLEKDENDNFMKKLIFSLQKKKLRLIPESDVGMAVAYGSTEKFCNPSLDVGSLVLSSPNIPSQTLSEREVYVPETQDQIQTPSSKRTLSSDGQQSNKRQRVEASDSLSLSSFKAEDAEEVFEIPLSAQVKKELGSIFDATMKAVFDDKDDVEELPATQPLNLDDEPSPRKIESKVENIIEENTHVPASSRELSLSSFNLSKRKIDLISESLPSTSRDVPNAATAKENEITAGSMGRSPKKMKIERNSSVVNHNGFNNVIENGNDNLPRNLIKVKYVDLVIRTSRPALQRQNQDPSVKNFKKFKKVFPKKSSVLPRIIGGHDLIPYDKDAAKFQTNLEEEVDSRINRAVKGAFDWDAS